MHGVRWLLWKARSLFVSANQVCEMLTYSQHGNWKSRGSYSLILMYLLPQASESEVDNANAWAKKQLESNFRIPPF